MDLGALNEAEHDATICLALKPSQHDARFVRAHARYVLKNLDGTMEDLTILAKGRNMTHVERDLLADVQKAQADLLARRIQAMELLDSHLAHIKPVIHCFMFPHIMESILLYAPFSSRQVLRNTSKDMRKQVDAVPIVLVCTARDADHLNVTETKHPTILATADVSYGNRFSSQSTGIVVSPSMNFLFQSVQVVDVVYSCQEQLLAELIRMFFRDDSVLRFAPIRCDPTAACPGPTPWTFHCKISKIVIFPYPEIYNMEAALSGAPFVGASHLNLRGDSVRKIIVNLSFEPQQNGCGVWWLAQPFWVRGPERWNARTSTAPRCEMVLVVADVALLSTPSEFNRSPTFVEHTWYYFTQSVVAALMTGFHVKVVGFETMIHLFRDATVKPEPTLEELVELCKDQFVRIMHATAVQLSQAQGYLPPPLDYVANHTTFVARNDYKSTLSKGEWEQETREDYGWL